MRQMRHFFFALIFNYLDGQKRSRILKSGKSVAFRHTLAGPIDDDQAAADLR